MKTIAMALKKQVHQVSIANINPQPAAIKDIGLYKIIAFIAPQIMQQILRATKSTLFFFINFELNNANAYMHIIAILKSPYPSKLSWNI